MEKWDDRKWWENGKLEDRKDFIFSHFCLVGSGKVEEWKKMSLNKFTYIFLLKNDAQLKQKSDK